MVVMKRQKELLCHTQDKASSKAEIKHAHTHTRHVMLSLLFNEHLKQGHENPKPWQIQIKSPVRWKDLNFECTID